MAVLRGADRELPIPDRCLVGRSRACDLVLAGRDVSGQHAVLQWSGAQWEAHDLGSRNGTYVDGVRLAGGARAPLRTGAQIGFGRESTPWILVDAAAPQLLALALDGGSWRTADGGYLALPGPDEPALSVYQEAGGRWVVDQDGTTRAVEDRALIEAHGLWRLYLPAGCGGTWEDDAAPALVAQLRLRFTVSRDEEHVELVAWTGERKIDLQVRAHHYPLLLLARRRLADRQAGLAPTDEGWIRQDDLKAMLRIDENHFNISVHRARTQLGKAGVADAAALIERRTGTRLLRLGVAAIEIATAEPARR